MSDTWARRKSRRAARRRLAIRASRTAAFSALGVSALLISLYLLFPVEEVRVEGNERLADSAILRQIPERASLALVGARSLEGEIESNPWVKGVSVNKKWDSGMVVVEVEERDAVLNASLAGGQRVVVAEDGTRLPGLGGDSLSRIEVDRVRLGKIRATQETLEESGVEVEAVESVGARGVELSVRGPEGSRSLVLFADGVGEGQARVLWSLLRERPEARYFDLRTPERVIVGGEPAGDSSDAALPAAG